MNQFLRNHQLNKAEIGMMNQFQIELEVSKESMPVSTNTDLPSKYPMKSLPENLKFDTANLKFAMSRDQIFLKNCKKIYI